MRAMALPARLVSRRSLLYLPIASVVLFRAAASAPSAAPSRYELLQLQLLHRHGDRAPNVRLRNDAFWSSTLPAPSTIAELAALFPIVTLADGTAPPPGSAEALGLPRAKGRPWGRLSTLGLAQLKALGVGLNNALTKGGASESLPGADFGPDVDTRGFLPTPDAEHVRVFSTGPPLTTTRTLESVRSLLSGLFPTPPRELGISLELMEPMIVDRAKRPAAQKEAEVAQEARLQEAEERLQVRLQVTEALVALGLLDVEASRAEQPGKWIGPALKCTALMEIMACLKAHGMELAAVGPEARAWIMDGSVDRWHDVYNDSPEGRVVMSYGAGAMCRQMLGTVLAAARGEGAKLVIYSGHDATLISVVCALGLDYRAWPPYASCFRVELLREKERGEKRVRFVLNGQALRLVGMGEDGDGTYAIEAIEALDRRLATMMRESMEEAQEARVMQSIPKLQRAEEAKEVQEV